MEELFGPTIREMEREKHWVRMRQEKETDRLLRIAQESQNPKPKPDPIFSLLIKCLSPFIIVLVAFVLFFIVVMIVCGIGALCG